MADYHDILYADFSFPEATTAAIGAAAQVHGAPLSRPSGLRVLDLGCGCAGHLLGLAALDPSGHYVGIDQSRPQIEVGRHAIDATGLGNATLYAADVRDLPADLGRFDVIVCHGVYSWVPPDVRRALLDAIRAHLAASGVAFLSANMLPGWRTRGTIRAVLGRAIDPALAPAERVRAARALLAIWEAGAATASEPAARAIAAEIAMLRETDDSYLLYEHLAPLNQAVWFTELNAAVEGAGLQVLGDAVLSNHRPLDPSVERALRTHAPTRTAAEELRDVIAHRPFRRALLVHHERTFDPEPHWRRLDGLWLHPRVRPDPENEGRFIGAIGGAIRIADPRQQALLDQLRAALPSATPFAALAPADLPTAERAAIGRAVLDLLYLGVVQALAEPPPVAPSLPERPLATALARERARQGARVANLRHESHTLTPAMRAVLAACDGTNTIDDLAAVLARAQQDGEAQILRGGEPTHDPGDLAGAAAATVQALWGNGFLTTPR